MAGWCLTSFGSAWKCSPLIWQCTAHYWLSKGDVILLVKSLDFSRAIGKRTELLGQHGHGIIPAELDARHSAARAPGIRDRLLAFSYGWRIACRTARR